MTIVITASEQQTPICKILEKVSLAIMFRDGFKIQLHVTVFFKVHCIVKDGDTVAWSGCRPRRRPCGRKSD